MKKVIYGLMIICTVCGLYGAKANDSYEWVLELNRQTLIQLLHKFKGDHSAYKGVSDNDLKKIVQAHLIASAQKNKNIEKQEGPAARRGQDRKKFSHDLKKMVVAQEDEPKIRQAIEVDEEKDRAFIEAQMAREKELIENRSALMAQEQDEYENLVKQEEQSKRDAQALQDSRSSEIQKIKKQPVLPIAEIEEKIKNKN